MARVTTAAAKSVPGAPKRSTPIASSAPPMDTSSVGKGAGDRSIPDEAVADARARGRPRRVASGATARSSSSTSRSSISATPPGSRVTPTTTSAASTAIENTAGPARVVRGWQERDVRRTVGRGRETQVAEPERLVDCASCLTALAHALAMATLGRLPSIRSAERKPTSPAASIGATSRSTMWCAAAGTRPSDRYSTPAARAAASVSAAQARKPASPD